MQQAINIIYTHSTNIHRNSNKIAYYDFVMWIFLCYLFKEFSFTAVVTCTSC